MIVHPENLYEFKVCMGTHYLGGYSGDDDSKRNCLRESTLRWENSVGTIRETAGKYPQGVYAAVVCSIQSECIFLQQAPRTRGVHLRK